MQEDPRGFLRRAAAETGVIVDEAQRVPELLSYLQVVVDERKAGPFVLTGSQQFLLAQQVNQSLAGRAAVLQLLPFSMAELSRRPALTPDGWVDAAGGTAGAPAAGGSAPLAPSRSLDEVLFAGMYPAIHHRHLEPAAWLDSYVSTYVERDARLVGAIGDLASFARFVGLCTGRSGQLLNLTSLGNDAGVSRVTASRWLSILSASYIVALLQPHFENFSRRLVNTPKLYFLDTGLMCALLGLRRAADLRVHPLRGACSKASWSRSASSSSCTMASGRPSTSGATATGAKWMCSWTSACAGCRWKPKRGKRWRRMPSGAWKRTSR